MFFLISFFWFIRTTKSFLFWLYLWQLKEYRLGRFIDHFRTAKGKQLILNKLLIFKVLLAIVFLCGFFFKVETLLPFFIILPFLILILYLLETAKFIFDFFQNKLKTPVLTKKIIVLIFIALILQVLFIVALSSYLRDEIGRINFIWAAGFYLIFDIFTPLIVSVIIVCFQPLTILLRNQIIKKAKQKRAKFKNLIVIGITGSYGKTSTKEFLFSILSTRFNVLKTKKHQNTDPALAQHILNELNSKHQIFIAETAAYSRGGIKTACDIVKPTIGIVCGVNEQHLALFGSMENLLSAEGGKELIDSLPKNGMAFFNVKNKYCRELYQKIILKKKFLYGENASFAGEENILGAMMVAKELGMSEEEISQAVEKIENKFPGIQIKKGINGLQIIDASYSANPTGVMAHLDYLKTWSGSEGNPSASYGVNKKIIIMPCLIELGSASERVHREIGKKIGQVCDLAIITTREMFDETRQEAQEQGMKKENILFIENTEKILGKIKDFTKEGDIILLEGRTPGGLIEQLII